MKNQKGFKRLLAVALCASMVLASAVPAVSARTSDSQDTFVQKMDSVFSDPTRQQRPGARWWLAEGSHTDETLIESIHELYDSGFGSLEFVALDESAYLDDATYAWGSEEWIHDSKVIVNECTKLGMGVSFTSGTHWSTANLTSIKPDEEAAAQELGYRTINLAAGETYSGLLPEAELTQFATKQKLVSVVSAKVTGTAEDGTVNLDQNSMTDVTELAGLDSAGNWQINYTAPEDGNYILFAFWQYGTSENYKPSVDKSFTINYYSKEGVEALIEYWEEHVLTEDMRELISRNGNVSMYMDSLELQVKGKNTTGNLWCTDYLEEFEARRGYDVSEYLPVLIMASPGGLSSAGSYSYGLEGNEELAAKIRSDLYQTNTDLYMEECLDLLTQWLHSFGMTLRAENSYGKEFEISQPVKCLDYVETESLEFRSEPDLFRGQAGAAHLYDIPYSSETGAILSENYWNNNNTFRQIFYTQFASGIQKTVTHGYSAAYGPEEHCAWPGFEGMMPIFAERFNKRQPSSVDYKQLWDHVSRLQAALMQGSAQMDIGILRTDYNYYMGRYRISDYENNYLRQNKGYYWQDTALQNAGYTYDYFSPYLLQDNEITCRDGLVQPESAGYQALIVFEEEMPYQSAQVLYQWAQDGLPVVIVDGPTEEIISETRVKYNERAAITTGANDGLDGQLAEVMANIKSLDSVKTVSSQAEVKDALASLNVRPRAEYTESNQNLMSVLRKGDDANYLYVYNYMYTDNQNYVGQISLDGVYKPYLVNTWTGKTDAVAEYPIQDGRTILNVDLAPGEVMLFALDPNSKEDVTVVAKGETVREVILQDGKPVMMVTESGKAKVEYSDGSTYETEVTAPGEIALSDWSLYVEDWQPGDKISRTEDRGLGYTTTEVTYDTKKIIRNAGKTELKPWKEIQEIGPDVSGVGYYTASFTLPENWSKQDNGLIFNAESFCGGTAALFVNGKQIAVNMDSRCADLSEYVTTGVNHLEVRVTSSLRNRMIVQGYEANWNALGNTHEVVPDSFGMTGETSLTAYVKVPVSASNADKSILAKVIAYAEERYMSSEFENAIADVQASYTKALEDARAVNANIGASQDEVDSAWRTMLTEVHKLGFVRGNKDTLGQLIETAEEFYTKLDLYTPSTAESFASALTEAKNTYNDDNAMKDDVAQAENSLFDAMIALRFKADKSVLESVLKEAALIDTTQFTAETVEAFLVASKEAVAVNSDLDATQQQVDAAAEDLKAAMNNLQAAADVSENLTQVQGDQVLTAGGGNAKTGETGTIAVVVASITLAGAGLMLSKKRK
ncbi:glycosyl hydrolase family 2, sugar binding domain protein [[Clostridium] methylpentosum DSM 5476]|uniref:Glycosyl hydrolase family 2, sugar binding domain protein n=1 Tax=[Clostridium] methylpentosum DSM 5476 TaxID=537013 RepID=C0ECM8_9FIRM|nr:glycosyl hydrolase family 2, sugar binding domain protein [[Clostridium] methylpentosum DSM 5476]MEE1491258.1 glycosyl hydrolase [Massilioclostridium sp.]